MAIRPRPDVTCFGVGDEAIVLAANGGRLYHLNETASLIWSLATSGVRLEDIVSALVESGAERGAVSQQVEALHRAWLASGLLIASPGEAASSVIAPRGDDFTLPAVETGEWCQASSTHRLDLTLCGTHFALLIDDSSAFQHLEELFANLRAARPDSSAKVIVYRLLHQRRQWILEQNGHRIASSGNRGLAPLVHGELLLRAHMAANALAGLHAACVARDDKCLVLPGLSGSGKSTLTAALVAAGLEYVTDELVILCGQPTRVQPFPVNMGIKAGSWRVLRERIAGLDKLPVWRRSDGQRVRYWRPPFNSIAKEPKQTNAIVFPRYDRDGDNLLEPVSAATALFWIAEAGYDTNQTINAAWVRSLIDWIEPVSCFRLRYSNLSTATDTIERLL